MRKILLISMILITGALAYKGLTVYGNQSYCKIIGNRAFCNYFSLSSCYRALVEEGAFCVIRGF